MVKENQHSLVIRCLVCQTEGIPADTVVCPNCGANIPSLLRDTLIPGTLLNGGAYQVDYVLGRGGFGITYKGKQTALEQLVAIKEFYLGEFTQRDSTTGRLMVMSDREQDFSRGLARFEREGKTLASLNHPNVVRVLNLFNDNGTTYLIMEYLSGKTLKAVMKEGRLPEERVRQIMLSLVDALGAVHDKGVYHLDIKPANVLIEPSGRVVLIDFGAARQGLSSHTTIPAYTPSYAPVEVMSAEQVGAYSDIFEMGMMLHEMVTGTLPPPALDRITKMGKVGEWQPDPEKVPEPWRTLIATAIPLRPDDRPQDVYSWWEPVMGSAGLSLSPSAASAIPRPETATAQIGGATPGTDIHAEAVVSPQVAKNGGEASYTTENNERGTFRCPPGIWDGAVHRIPGQGNPGKNGGRPGALVIKVRVRQGAPTVEKGNSNSGTGTRFGSLSGNSLGGSRGNSVSGLISAASPAQDKQGMPTAAKVALGVTILIVLGLLALLAQAFFGGDVKSKDKNGSAAATNGKIAFDMGNGLRATEFCPKTELRASSNATSPIAGKFCEEHAAKCPKCGKIFPLYDGTDRIRFCDDSLGKHPNANPVELRTANEHIAKST